MTSSIDIKKFMTVIPELSSEVERCSFLQKGLSDPVRIAVFGKYNHGKSTLLNAVIGKEGVFKASDARETVTNQEFFDKDRNIIWVDTPGLDADLHLKDDIEAKKAVITTADIILLVHNVKTGELDKYEVDYYKMLLSKKPDPQKSIFLLLTQIDQINSNQLPNLLEIISKQMPELTILEVSATRYMKGISENKAALVERSGILSLLKMTQQCGQEVQELRALEIKKLKRILHDALVQKKSDALALVSRQRTKLEKHQAKFRQEVQKIITNVQSKL